MTLFADDWHCREAPGQWQPASDSFGEHGDATRRATGTVQSGQGRCQCHADTATAARVTWLPLPVSR